MTFFEFINEFEFVEEDHGTLNFVAAAAAAEEGSPLAFPWVLVGVFHVFRCMVIAFLSLSSLLR